MKKIITIFLAYYFTLLNALPPIQSPINLTLSIQSNNETIDLLGSIHSPDHIQKILSIITDSDYTIETKPEPFIYRYPYDFSYTETNAYWDTVIGTTGFYSSAIRDFAFFPNGKKIVVVGNPRPGNGNVGRIYSFADTGSTIFGNATDVNNNGKFTFTWGGPNTVYTVTTVAIRNDSQHILIGGVRTPNNVTHRLLYFDEYITNSLYTIADFDHGTTVRSIDWSPNGKYVAVAGDTTSNNINLRIYRFEYGTLHALSRSEYFWHSSNPIYTVKWHPNGNYLAIGGALSASGHTVKVLSFSQESLNELIGCRTDNSMTVGHVPEVDWSPDGTKLAVAHIGASAAPKVYSFNNNLKLDLYSTGSNTGSQVNAVSYSPDGAYISFAQPTRIDTYTSYDDGGTLSQVGLLFTSTTATFRHISWDPGANFLAMASDQSVLTTLRLVENQVHLAKRLQNEIFNLYSSAKKINSITQNVLKPLAIANSNALVTYYGKTPASYTKTFTQSLSTNPNYIVTSLDTSEDGQVVVIGSNLFPRIKTFSLQGNLLIEIPYAFTNDPETLDAIAISSNNKYIAGGSISAGYTIVYTFNGYYLKSFTSTTTGANCLKWFADGKTLMINDGAYELRKSSIPPIFAQSFKASDLDSTRQYMAAISNLNILTIYRLGTSYTSLVTITSTPVSALGTIGSLSWNNATTICMTDTTDIGKAFAAYYFNGTTLSLVGTGVTQAQINKIATDPLGRHMTITLTTDGTIIPNILEYSITPTTGPIILIGSIQHTTAAGTISPFAVKYTSDSNYIIIGNKPLTGTVENISVYKRNYTPFPYAIEGSYTILIGTSYGSNNSAGGNALNIATSDAIVTYKPLNIANSNVIVSNYNLIIQNSNAIASILVGTSNLINNLVIPTSQVITSIGNLVFTTSNAIVTHTPLIKETSQGIVTYQPLALANSNAIAGLLVDTSNAFASILPGTSHATAELLVATSNAIVTHATQFAPLDFKDVGPSHIHFNAPTITLTYPLFISPDHELHIHQSCLISGSGNTINFAKANPSYLFLDAGITVTLQDVHLLNYNDNVLSLGSNASLLFGQSTYITLLENQSLLRTWSCIATGDAPVSIHGSGRSLELGTNEKYISNNGTLEFTNITLKNMRDYNLRSLHHETRIDFMHKTALQISADFTYSQGALAVTHGDLSISGSSTFNYTSMMGFTVASQAKLIFDQKTRFNYAPASNFRDLLYLTDSTSQLIFNNATLMATTTGLRLINGNMIVNGALNIQSSATSPAEAIIFGNGTPANDLIITLMPASGINLLSGYLNYANAN